MIYIYKIHFISSFYDL